MKTHILLTAVMLCAASLYSQTVSSSLVGVVVDPADAVVPNVPVTLIDKGTGAARTATTGSSGEFRFLNLAPSVYDVTIKAPGFKAMTQTGITVAASETHNAGTIALQIGEASESVSVTAESAQIQLASSEKSQTVDGNQLNDITLKGRDLFGYMKLVPGVIDTTASRDVTSPNAIGGITINGNTSAKNFTVDGITDMDTGSNGTLHYEPNIDAIQEMKVLTSNYAAEFGRNSGGTITVVTKSGTQSFHGTGAWNHRHEGFNANTWLNNHTLTNGKAAAVQPYRFNVETYSIGGPAYIPRVVNKDKKHLFFFWSQEYTGQFVNGGTQYKYTPTALERGGDFSQSFNNNGSLLVITDPTTGAPFAGNQIPVNRLNPVGVAMLNFFPLPNYTPTLPAQANIVNYFEAASASHPRRNDVLRFDTYVTSKLSGYFRWINDHDNMTSLYQGVSFTQDIGGVLGQKGIAPINHPNPGHGYSGTAIWTISPTVVNEATVGESWNTWSWYSTDNYASQDRSLVPGLPTLFPIPTPAQSGSVGAVNGYQNILPQFSFGNPPSTSTFGSMAYARNSTSAGAYENFNTIWTYQDNLSKVIGGHSIKTGVYVEKNNKIQPAGQSYMGNFNFATSTANPLVNTGNGFVNALLGNVNSYSQSTARTTFDAQYWNVEFYVQDNWKVNRRLTLDLGVRFYHQTPQIDLNHTFVNFVPANYSPSAMARIFTAGCLGTATTCSGANRIAIDRPSGTTANGAYIGAFVPNTGSYSSGLTQLGLNGVSSDPYHQAPIAAGPRLGFAYDLMGDGKTALRGGWGIFYNRLDGNQVYGMSGQPPLVYTAVANFTSFAAIAAQNTGATDVTKLVIAPPSPSAWIYSGNVPWDAVQNASLALQRNVGANTVVDVGYTFNWGYNQHLTYNLNYLPLGTQYPFTPSNLDPTTSGSNVADKGSIFERTAFPGYGNVTGSANSGHTNYNALTATINRRIQRGLQWTATYTYSKAMGVTSFNPVVTNNDSYNYGRLASDRTHNLQISYIYEFPGIGKKLGSRALGLVTDNWQLSGITSFQSGAPFNPACNVSSGTAPNYTGTPDLTARCNVIGDPRANLPQNGNGQVYFRASAFAIPALATGPNNTIVGAPTYGTLGGGAGVLSLPHYTNFDVTLTKRFLLGSERRVLKLQAQAYNVFNHPEYNAIGTAIQFAPTGATAGSITNQSAVGIPTGTLPSRILAFSARIEF